MKLGLGCNNDESCCCSSSPYRLKRIVMMSESEKEMKKGFKVRIVERVLFFDQMQGATP